MNIPGVIVLEGAVVVVDDGRGMDPPVFGQARSETALRPLIHFRIGHTQCGDRHTRRLRRKVAPQEFVLGGMPPRAYKAGSASALTVNVIAMMRKWCILEACDGCAQQSSSWCPITCFNIARAAGSSSARLSESGGAGSRSAGSGAQSCLLIFNRFRSALFFLQGARLARPSCLSAGSGPHGALCV